ncbi:MAG: hypothetical protein H8D78_07230 [Chloroflexi bacterium]|nr:hypothetical protein [Chloroflexota bacterium]
MKPEELREEIAIELELMEATVQELLALQHDLVGREPTVREKTAAAAFLAQFYNGVENILKRISRFHAIPLPTGGTWHVDLFKRFCMPPYEPLPALFNESLASALAPFRRFRHVVYHGYGFELDWSRMHEGVESVESVFVQFKSTLSDYLQTLTGK